jgi:hypothetical protein
VTSASLMVGGALIESNCGAQCIVRSRDPLETFCVDQISGWLLAVSGGEALWLIDPEAWAGGRCVSATRG